jgi:lipopolysaccharide biosynthesis glycosyltransferase
MKVFIGYDSRENIAYQVAKSSLLKHSSIPLEVTPIVLNDMRYRGIYKREPDALAATEFSFTRFLTPYLAGYTGWALFCDCDFLFRGDIAAVTDYMDRAKAMLCVPHKYTPTETIKMDGKAQHQYPRKNWSSFMLINCEHDQVRALTPEVVNTQTGMYLHRFEWLTDDVIGELPIAFNYLEGWYTKDDCPNPIAVHFTRGGPWFNEWQNVEYAAEWMAVANKLHADRDGIE